MAGESANRNLFRLSRFRFRFFLRQFASGDRLQRFFTVTCLTERGPHGNPGS